MSELRLTASTTFSETLSGLTISAAWSKIYLTALVRKGDAATDAILQLVETNPADDDDGLLYLDGSAPTAAAEGALVVTQASGTIGITVADDATADFVVPVEGTYSVKEVLGTGVSNEIDTGTFFVDLTESKAVA